MNDLIILDRDKIGAGKAIPTKEGMSAIERASNRWWKIELPEVDVARHERFMAAIRRIDPKPQPVRKGPWRPGAKWRYLRHEHENERRKRSCSMCSRTGELTVDDGHGGVEYELCPTCQRCNPFRDQSDLRDVSNF